GSCIKSAGPSSVSSSSSLDDPKLPSLAGSQSSSSSLPSSTTVSLSELPVPSSSSLTIPQSSHGQVISSLSSNLMIAKSAEAEPHRCVKGPIMLISSSSSFTSSLTKISVRLAFLRQPASPPSSTLS